MKTAKNGEAEKAEVGDCDYDGDGGLGGLLAKVFASVREAVSKFLVERSAKSDADAFLCGLGATPGSHGDQGKAGPPGGSPAAPSGRAEDEALFLKRLRDLDAEVSKPLPPQYFEFEVF